MLITHSLKLAMKEGHGHEHECMEPQQLYSVYSNCSSPTFSTPNSGSDVCQLCSEIAPCGFYDHHHRLLVNMCSLDHV